MTTFEITIIVLLAAIVVLLAWHCALTRNNYSLNQTKESKRQQDFERLFRKIGSMELLAVDNRRILKELMEPDFTRSFRNHPKLPRKLKKWVKKEMNKEGNE